MKKEKLYIFILSILNTIILYNKNFGFNVLLFTIPLLLFIYFYLKLNKLIVNKNGLLFMIPIIILSSTFFIYDNLFVYLNILAIPVLYLLMYIYTLRKECNLISIICDAFKLVLFPIVYVGKLITSLTKNVKISIKIKDENKKKIKSLLIVLPVVIIILMLLGSADMIFGNMFKGLFDLLDKINNIDYGELPDMIVYTLILFAYTASTMLFLKDFPKEKIEKANINIEEYTIKLLLTILNIIYVVFDIIQINSLMLHRVSQNINYAEYARSGFFQLMFISMINIVIILLSKKSKETKYNKNMSLVMIGLTFIIIISSFMRMYLYESAYGYTVLRLGVYVILITEVILFIPTIMYILNKKIDILKSYIVIITIVYTFVNMFSIDKIITNNNINRYYKIDDLDIIYLENNQYDNIPQLVDLYKKCDDEEIKKSLKIYLEDMKNNVTIDPYSILEYNKAKRDGAKVLNEVDFEESFYTK